MITHRDSRDSSCLREIDALLLFRDGVTGMRSCLPIRAPIPLTSVHSTISYLSLPPSLLPSFPSLYFVSLLEEVTNYPLLNQKHVRINLQYNCYCYCYKCNERIRLRKKRIMMNWNHKFQFIWQPTRDKIGNGMKFISLAKNMEKFELESVVSLSLKG